MIGGFEVLGAAGLILPGLTGIKRHLTSVAAGCLAFIMLGAVVVSFAQMGVTAAIMPFVVGDPRSGRDVRPPRMAITTKHTKITKKTFRPEFFVTFALFVVNRLRKPAARYPDDRSS